MKPFRLIALDVDGTLITDDHVLTEPTKQILQQLYAEGIQILLCTGRGPVSALPVLKELQIESVLITHNGALTLHSKDHTILHQFSYPVSSIETLLSYCREKHIHFDVNTAFEMYTEQMPPNALEMYRKYFADPIVKQNAVEDVEGIVKFTAFGTKQEMDALEQKVDGLIAGKGLRAIRSGDDFVDIMHVEATKGTALAKYCEMHQIKPEEVIAFGNYFNDIEMLRFSGLGIAMANSPQEVKEAADEVTLSNNDNGVAVSLKKRFVKA